MEDMSPLATILVAVLSSSVIAAIISNRASYKSIAVEAITKERITWLDELRKIAADFSASLAEIYRDGDGNSNLKKADTLIARLQLQLNPRGGKEKHILKLADQMIATSKESISNADATSCVDEYRKIEKCFMIAVRELLKEEWEKAKTEAGVVKNINLPYPEFGMLLGVIGLTAVFALLKNCGVI